MPRIFLVFRPDTPSEGLQVREVAWKWIELRARERDREREIEREREERVLRLELVKKWGITCTGLSRDQITHIEQLNIDHVCMYSV